MRPGEVREDDYLNGVSFRWYNRKIKVYKDGEVIKIELWRPYKDGDKDGDVRVILRNRVTVTYLNIREDAVPFLVQALVETLNKKTDENTICDR